MRLTTPTLHARIRLPMKFLRLGIPFLGALALLAFVTGCATTGQTARESTLTRAGFHQVMATTPKQKAIMAQLPANSISRVSKDGAVWFVFPSQTNDSAMVGTAAQLNEYNVLTRSQQMQPISLSNGRVATWNSFGGPAWSWGGRTTVIAPPGS